MKVLLVFAALVVAAAAQCAVTGVTSLSEDNSVTVVSTGCDGYTFTLFHTKPLSSATQATIDQLKHQLVTLDQDIGSAARASDAQVVNIKNNPTRGAQHGSYMLQATDGATTQWSGPWHTGCSKAGRTAGDAYSPPTFVKGTGPNDSKLEGAGVQIVFKGDRQDNAVAFAFVDHDAPATNPSFCGRNFNGGIDKDAAGNTITAQATGAADNGGVWDAPTYGAIASCNNQALYKWHADSLSNAMGFCGWTSGVDGDKTVQKVGVKISTLQQGLVLRGMAYTKVQESLVRLQIVFVTRVEVNSTVIRVFGPVQFAGNAEVFKQVYNPYTKTMAWAILTSVQGPYQLSADESFGGSFQPAITATPNVFENKAFRPLISGDLAGMGISGLAGLAGAHADQKPQCLKQDGSGETNYGSNTSTYEPCTQYWFLTAKKADSVCDAGASANWDGDWSAHYNVACHSTFTGSCATPSTSKVSFDWKTYSDDICPRIVDTDAATAELTVFQDAGRTAAQTQFVWGTTSYFRMTVTSNIKMEETRIERIAITAGQPSPATDLVLFNVPFGAQTTEAYFTGYGTAKATAVNAVAGSVLAVADANPDAASATGAGLKKENDFDFKWSDVTSGASGDEPSTTTIQVDSVIRYVDQAANTPKLRTYVLSTKFASLQATADTVSGKATFGVAKPTTAAAPGASGATEAAVSTQTIAIGAAAVGGVALVAAGVAVAMRRRNAKSAETMTNMDAVRLGSVSTLQV